jgi:uncharacterized membrane protein
LSFKLPDLNKEETHWSVHYQLHHLLPNIVAYTFSFIMVGIFWINHHHMYHLLKRTDSALMVQNLFFLFCMSFIPLATAFLGANPFIDESVAFYGLVMLLTTFSFSIMRSYSIRKMLVHRDEDEKLTKEIKTVSVRARTKAYIGTVAYLFSVPLAFYNVYFSFACFAVTPILFFIHDGIDDEKLSEKIVTKNE